MRICKTRYAYIYLLGNVIITPVARIMMSASTMVSVDSTTLLGPLKEATVARSVVKAPDLYKSKYPVNMTQMSALKESDF